MTSSTRKLKFNEALITESEFPVKKETAIEDATEALKMLRHEKVTGTFIIHLASGGIQRMVMTEKQKVLVET